MTTGPDFSEVTKQTLAKRAGQVCSNPECRRPTSGPHSDETKAINLGEAAHIQAARPGQARFDINMTDVERADITNGIWLCKECARRIDIDQAKYPVACLTGWKNAHEKWILDGKVVSSTKVVQSIINDTYSLYNDTGLFVKYCFLENPGNRLRRLNDSFESYLRNIKGKLALVPQVLELKILQLFDILFEYTRRGEIIFLATKTNNRYADQQELEKEFIDEVSPLYAEIEGELKKLLNNST